MDKPLNVSAILNFKINLYRSKKIIMVTHARLITEIGQTGMSVSKN